MLIFIVNQSTTLEILQLKLPPMLTHQSKIFILTILLGKSELLLLSDHFQELKMPLGSITLLELRSSKVVELVTPRELLFSLLKSNVLDQNVQLDV